ncbi:hypothetical protein Dfri01_65640 [Dyadobacter frigoris]|uniref:hypothetical protein n=1 Tax=Dyadobacter frigoris TaxID=2576211 RepID=UPI0024A2A2B6|nr:hypothetical protein [Dyadobacter frigoris]GLU57103.1 hypothetical protein Dfri01_65640 [Dyadobacter frigoris]
MNHLLAKTKGRDGYFFKVISNEEIFKLPDDLDNPVEYSSDYKLEDDEWFAIKNFSEKEYCIEFLTRRFLSIDYNQLPVDDYNKIDFLCAYQTGVYYFQKLSSSQIIRKKYFSFSAAPTLIENEPIIVIDNYPDAIYLKEKDILYFKRLTSITAIFKGIDELYKEATKEETEAFLESDFIVLANEYSAEKVKKANRKRIAMAMATLQRFSQVERSDIFVYIREYCEGLSFDENDENFTISDEEELKKLLYGIEQRYYTTRQGGEKRLANSVTTIQ